MKQGSHQGEKERARQLNQTMMSLGRVFIPRYICLFPGENFPLFSDRISSNYTHGSMINMNRNRIWQYLFLSGSQLLISLTWDKSSQAQEEILNLYQWSEYIDPEIISEFEEITDSTVIVSNYDSNEEMIAKLKGGGVSQYDLVIPSDYMIPDMIQAELLQAIDQDYLPNIENLDPTFQDLPFDPESVYTIPFQWGTTGIGYRKDQLPETFDRSWGLIFDPEQELGPFSLIDDQRPMIGGAAAYLGFDRNTAEPIELRQIQELLLQAKRRSTNGFVGGLDSRDQLLSGSAILAVVYSGDIYSEENPNLGYFIPREGGEIWLDNLVIPAAAPNPTLAHEFINYILEPEVSAKLSNYNRFATPNRAAKPLINPEDRSNLMIYPDDDTMDILSFSMVLPEETMQLLDALWDAVKSSK